MYYIYIAQQGGYQNNFTAGNMNSQQSLDENKFFSFLIEDAEKNIIVKKGKMIIKKIQEICHM